MLAYLDRVLSATPFTFTFPLLLHSDQQLPCPLLKPLQLYIRVGHFYGGTALGWLGHLFQQKYKAGYAELLLFYSAQQAASVF